ncbi:MAG: hypothetical protein ISS26_05690 [Candidatus Omnitrophica bacterium]|nr:hypothetical protein [Candidatus Omnitrophota bacterium]
MNTLRVVAKEKAIDLRRKGLSLAEISHKIDIPKNTVQGWVKRIKLTENQLDRLRKKEIECGKRGLSKALKVNKDRKIRWQESVRRRVEEFRTALSEKSDVSKLLCGTLYLCEGAKYPASRHLVFGNSDPRMIKLFLKLLRDNFFC